MLVIFKPYLSGHSSGSDYKRQHQKAAAKLGITISPASRSRGSAEQQDDGSSGGSLSRSLSKTPQESSQNPIFIARPDLLENAIVLADYRPIAQDRKSCFASSTGSDNPVSEDNVEEAVEGNIAIPHSDTPKRENPFHKPNL